MQNSEIILKNLFQVSLSFCRHNSTCRCTTPMAEEYKQVSDANKQVCLKGSILSHACMQKREDGFTDFRERAVQTAAMGKPITIPKIVASHSKLEEKENWIWGSTSEGTTTCIFTCNSVLLQWRRVAEIHPVEHFLICWHKHVSQLKSSGDDANFVFKK